MKMFSRRSLLLGVSMMLGYASLACGGEGEGPEVGESIIFDMRHEGVAACTQEDARRHAAGLCRRKFRIAADSEVAVVLLEFSNHIGLTGWPFGARCCWYEARASCKIETL